MTTYVAETIPGIVVRDMLWQRWDQRSNLEIPKPTILEVNDPDTPERFDIGNQNDHLIISIDTPGLSEDSIGNETYGHQETNVIVGIFTSVSRQRLWDLAREIRRICHNQRHSLSQYQRIGFVSFNEQIAEERQVWTGRIIINLINNAVVLET
jgi:hypothetical protein